MTTCALLTCMLSPFCCRNPFQYLSVSVFWCVCVVFLVFLGLCFVFCYFLCLFEYFESFLGLCVFAVVLFVFLGLLVVLELVVYSEEKQFYPR